MPFMNQHTEPYTEQHRPPIYAGVGSRNAPPDILESIKHVAKSLASVGYVLRTGGAGGSDTAFIKGAIAGFPYSKQSSVEVYRPYWGMSVPERYIERVQSFQTIEDEAYKIAKRRHPAWDRMNDQQRALIARNVHILLGRDLANPVDFVLLWTPKGRQIGGTGFTWKLANEFGIPVFMVV